MNQSTLLDVPAEFSSWIGWDGATPVFRAQALLAFAGGRGSASPGCADQFEQWLDRLVQSSSTSTGSETAALRIDFGHGVDGVDASDLPDLDGAPASALRCTALRHARRLWNHALDTLVRARIAAQGGNAAWESRPSGRWLQHTPVGHEYARQGWKIHLSATPANAPRVLAACVDLLLAARVPFKHAARLDDVEALFSAKINRGNGGKFITIYPADENQARHLLQQLDVATSGLPGPRILSDQCLRPGSLVHYRYGVFAAPAELSNDGVYESFLLAPDGSRVQDSRKAWFDPPAWVPPLLEQAVAEQQGATAAQQPVRSVLLAGRYRVTAAIRHANRGGVYRAMDEHDGSAVIVKQARPGTSAELCGHDAVAALRQEAASLLRLQGLGAAFVELFEYQGHAFLVQEAIQGKNLRDWMAQRCTASTDAGPQLDASQVRELALQVCRMLVEIHQRGLVCRDFNPNNLMVQEAGGLPVLRLIDTELMAAPGSLVHRYYTYGFAAPELLLSEKSTLCPDFSVDVYSLGALLYFIATARMPPVQLPGDSADSLALRWAICLEELKQLGHGWLAGMLAPLLAFEPRQRPQAQQVLEWMQQPRQPPGRAVMAPQRVPIRQFIEDGNHYILNSMKSGGARIWPSGAFGGSTDECNVQHGAAGVLGHLCLQDASWCKQHADQLRGVADWIGRRLARRTQLLPGLYFGASGAALACLQSAQLLGDVAAAERALAQLLRLPTRWPNPDICHGLAGAGVALCEAWQRTGDSRLLAPVSACADHLLGTVREHAVGVHWTVAEDFESTLRGVSHLGFAHGVAGIGHFLLLAGVLTGRADCLDMAHAAGRTLLRAADHGGWGVRWRSAVQPGSKDASDMGFYWCSGAAGIGGFLARLWHVGKVDAFRELALQAAHAVHRIRWHSGTCACHGLAGNGEFLLDMARYVDPACRALALDLVDCLRVKSTRSGDGRWLVTDESETAVTVDYNTGLSGVLAFLTRLQQDQIGPRLWSADAVLDACAAVRA